MQPRYHGFENEGNIAHVAAGKEADRLGIAVFEKQVSRSLAQSRNQCPQLFLIGRGEVECHDELGTHPEGKQLQSARMSGRQSALTRS